MGDGPKSWQEYHTEQENTFYQWMGRCVSAWAFADEALFDVFRDCVGPYEQAAILYYRMKSLDARMATTDELVRSLLPKKDRKNGGQDHPDVVRWKGAKKAFGDLLGVRSRIAHQQVHVAILASEIDENGNPTDTSDFRTALEILPGTHERMKEIGSVMMADYEQPSLTIDDLKRHQTEVVSAGAAINLFRADVLSKLPELPRLQFPL